MSIVCVPGTLCDKRLFAPLLAQLGQVSTYAAPVAHPSVGDVANAIIAHAPKRFVAVGFSLGGFVVLELLRRYPDRLAGAVLIASNALPLQDAPEAKRADLALFADRGGKAVVARHWAAYVAPANAHRADIRDLVELMAEQTPLANFTAQTEIAIYRPDSRDVIAETTVPTLKIDGAQDRMSPPGRNRALKLSSAVRRVEISEAGHFLPLEAPAEAASAIASFIEEFGLCCSA